MSDHRPQTPNHSIPRPGMFASVRNRRGVVSAVEPYDGPTGRLHLVHLEYKDDHYPPEDRLLWELEPHKTLLEPTAPEDLRRRLGAPLPTASAP